MKNVKEGKEIRTRNNNGRPWAVMVRGGKYFLDETFVLGPEDGGTRE